MLKYLNRVCFDNCYHHRKNYLDGKDDDVHDDNDFGEESFDNKYE